MHRHWRHRRGPPWRGGWSPVMHFMRFRLHRRIFLWSGLSIVMAIGATALIWHFASPSSSWTRDMQGAQHLLASRFEKVWDDPAGRQELERELKQDFGVDVTPVSATGTPLDGAAPCSKPWAVPVQRGEARLGTVGICMGPGRSHGPWSVVWPLLLAAGLLWAVSGKIAVRLTRPLSELVRVAQDIGSGKLSTRSRLAVQRHGEVAVLGEAINDMAGRIERQMADQRELLAAVSHELRTPLARIRIITELIRVNGATPKTLDELDREVVEIDKLVGDLLASSRLEFSALSLHRLNAAEVASRAAQRAGLDGGKLQTATDASFEGDATLIARALSNLIENAKEHAGGVDALRVAAPRPGFVAFEVDDRGPGFADGDDRRAFEAFYHRARDPDRDQGGLGMGLALVRRIAEAHGGAAYARNREGGGATVGFEVKAG